MDLFLGHHNINMSNKQCRCCHFSAFTLPKRRRTHSDSSLPTFDPRPDLTSVSPGGRRGRYVHRQTSIQEDNEERSSEGDNKQQEESEPEDLDKDIDTVFFE